MGTYNLKASSRQIFRKRVNELRKRGILPAIVYGHKIASRAIEVNKLDFEKIYREVGSSNLVDLIVDNEKPVKVLIQDVQIDVLSNEYTHVDFHQVKMTEKITTNVKLEFFGESLAVKELGAVLVKNFDEIEIECLPGDLISEIKVDISKLKKFGDIIHLKDLAIPKNIKLLSNVDEAVVLVSEPREEEEIKPATEETVVEPTVEGEKVAVGEQEIKNEDEVKDKKSSDHSKDK